MDKEETLFTTQAACEWLDQAIPGESQKYWRNALINNRRQERNPPHRIPFSTMGKTALYTLEALHDFAGFEKSRRLGQMKLTGRAAEVVRAFGIGQGGTSTGRILNISSIIPQVDETTGRFFVQVVISDPLLVFRLDADEAKSIGHELIEAGDVCERTQQ